MNDQVIVLLGPTAAGKTAVSIELAKKCNGEIISADSMQVYKYMDIGTAKPDEEERQGIKHYLIDEVTPDKEFSVAQYQQLALKYIQEVLDKGKIPILTGGTGLYIQSVVDNLDFTETVSDPEYRDQLQKEAVEQGNKFIHDKLREVDPASAERIHVNDAKRIIRALEVYKYTGQTITYHQQQSRLKGSKYRFIMLGISMDRQKLYERIDSRVDKMLVDGLVEEVKGLMDRGYDKNSVAMQGLGYKEILQYLKGEITLDEAVYILKRDTRHYAKRQLTWFRRDKRIIWIDSDEAQSFAELLENFYKILALNGIIL